VPSLRAHVAHTASEGALHRIGAVLGKRSHLHGLAFMAVLTVAGFIIIPFISPYIVANAGVAERSLPYVYFFGGFATAFTSRWAGRLADRHGKGRVFAAAAWLSLIPTLLVTNLQPAPLALIIVCTALFMILSNARWVPALALVTGSVPPHQRGSFLNLSFAVQQMAAGLASFAAGIIIGRTPGGALTHYWMVGLLGAAATLAALALARGVGRET
jgi:predicted MFS family arabinose efflux permease